MQAKSLPTAAPTMDGWTHLEAVERAARFGYWRLTLADKSMFWSPGLYRLLGADPQKQAPDLRYLLGQTADAWPVLRGVRGAIARRAPFHFRVRLGGQDCDARIIDTQGGVELGPDGEIVAIVGVCTDVSLREAACAQESGEGIEQEQKYRAALARAEAANRTKALFLANMSHELRTRLNTIIGFADIMCAGLFGDLGSSRYEEYAAQICNSGRFLLNQFCDILEVAHVEAGLLEFKSEHFDLAETVCDCALQIQTVAEERGVSLALDLPQDGAWITGDRRAAHQIVLNLLSNALKFTKRQGHVWVELQPGDGKTLFLVRDDGIGIPAGTLERFGRPFEQACSDPYLATRGQGLGLALVHALAAKLGGYVAIASEEGKGTEVCVELPARPLRAAA